MGLPGGRGQPVRLATALQRWGRRAVSGLFEREVENGSDAPTRSFADRTPTQSCRSKREKGASTVCPFLLVQRREGFVLGGCVPSELFRIDCSRTSLS